MSHNFAAMREALRRPGGAVQVAVAPQLFPTPPHVAARMVEMLDLENWAGEPWGTLRVLEPSAGTGNLLDALLAVVPEADLVAWEINYALADALLLKYRPAVRVMQGDFLLSAQHGPLDLFDAVAMNPPFERGIWEKHLRHAWAQVRPDGRLVACLPQASKVHDVCASLTSVWVREDLPENTFAGTGVRTCLVLLDKPE